MPQDSRPPRVEPTPEDRQHLIQAMKDVAEGWKLHPFTCARFEAIGWLDKNGWTQSAYDARKEVKT